MSHARTIKRCKAIADELGIRYRFRRSKHTSSGFAEPDKVTVVYSEGAPDHYISSIFCHEVQHVLCRREGKYAIFHNSQYVPWNLGLEGEIKWLKTIVRTALKAERYVDKRAQAYHKVAFKGQPFLKAYQTPNGVQFLQLQTLAPIKRMIAEREARVLAR